MDLRHVVDELILAFRLRERAVALVDAKRVTKLGTVANCVINIEGWETRGIGVIQVQTGNSGSGSGLGAIAVRDVKDVIFFPTETELVYESWV